MGLFTMPGRARDTEQWGKKGEHPTPPGNADVYQNKGVAVNATRKSKKTKD
jgi:hypothetical protein